MLPLRVVLDRNRGGSYLVFLLVGAGLFAMFLFLTYYFQINLGYSPLKAGFAFLPFSVGIILTAGVVAQLLPRVGPKPLMVPGLVMAVVGMLLLTQITQDTSYWTHVFPAEVLMSVGLAGVFIPAVEHGAGRRRSPRRRRRQRGAQHLPADRRLAGHGAAQHAVRRRGDGLPRRQPDHRPDARPRRRPSWRCIHGYHVAFFWGAVLLAAALVVASVFINAKKEDVPTGAGMAAAPPDPPGRAHVPVDGRMGPVSDRRRRAQLGQRAGRAPGRRRGGGGAVDAAVAAILVTMVTEPGIVSLAGGAFATVWPAGEPDAVTVDGYVAMPGLGRPLDAPDPRCAEVRTDYGGGRDDDRRARLGGGPRRAGGAGPAALSGGARCRGGRWSRRRRRSPGPGSRWVPASGYYLRYVRETLFGWDPRDGGLAAGARTGAGWRRATGWWSRGWRRRSR